MTLPEHYQNLPKPTAPKTELLKAICEQCRVTCQTVQNWVLNGTMPSSKEHCDAIAEITGLKAEELFPGYTEKFITNESKSN